MEANKKKFNKMGNPVLERVKDLPDGEEVFVIEMNELLGGVWVCYFR